MAKGRWVPSVVAVVLSGCGAFTAVGLGEDDPPSSSSSSSSSSGTSGVLEAGTDALVLPRRVFVTPEVLPGGFAAGKDVEVAADAFCKASAGAGGGNWVAWVSVTGKPARDRLGPGKPWHLGTPAGPVVFDNAGQIAASMEPKVAIDRDATGATVAFSSGTEYVWTGTTANGSPSGQDCLGWTSTAVGGRAGNPKSTTDWTSFVTSNCAFNYHLYCFEK